MRTVSSCSVEYFPLFSRCAVPIMHSAVLSENFHCLSPLSRSFFPLCSDLFPSVCSNFQVSESEFLFLVAETLTGSGFDKGLHLFFCIFLLVFRSNVHVSSVFFELVGGLQFHVLADRFSLDTCVVSYLHFFTFRNKET